MFFFLSFLSFHAAISFFWGQEAAIFSLFDPSSSQNLDVSTVLLLLFSVVVFKLHFAPCLGLRKTLSYFYGTGLGLELHRSQKSGEFLS